MRFFPSWVQAERRVREWKGKDVNNYTTMSYVGLHKEKSNVHEGIPRRTRSGWDFGDGSSEERGVRLRPDGEEAPADVRGSAFLQRGREAFGPGGGEGPLWSVEGRGRGTRRGWSRWQGQSMTVRLGCAWSVVESTILTRAQVLVVYILTQNEFPQPTREVLGWPSWGEA